MNQGNQRVLGVSEKERGETRKSEVERLTWRRKERESSIGKVTRDKWMKGERMRFAFFIVDEREEEQNVEESMKCKGNTETETNEGRKKSGRGI